MRSHSLLIKTLTVTVLASSLTTQAGCGWLLVDSPRTAGLECSQSKFLPYVDILLAAGLASALVVGGAAGEAPASLSVPAVFAVSGLWGVHKVNQCRNKINSMSPEDWANHRAAVAEQNRVAAENAARVQQILARAVLIQAPPPPAGGNGNAAPPPRPQPTGTKTLTINGRVYTDRADGLLGMQCSLDNNTCPSPAYACVLITSTSGVCAPSS
jgi:hypothetical protein